MALTRCYACGKMASTDYPCTVCGGERHIEPEVSSMPRVSLEDRKTYIATIPWVRRLVRKTECDGWMARRKRCKNKAEWSFRPLRKYRGWWLVHRDEPRWRHYCWSHLSSRGLYGSMEEEARTETWMKKNPPSWKKDDDARRQGSEPEGEGSSREREIPGSSGVRPNAGGGAQDGDQ